MMRIMGKTEADDYFAEFIDGAWTRCPDQIAARKRHKEWLQLEHLGAEIVGPEKEQIIRRLIKNDT